MTRANLDFVDKLLPSLTMNQAWKVDTRKWNFWDLELSLIIYLLSSRLFLFWFVSFSMSIQYIKFFGTQQPLTLFNIKIYTTFGNCGCHDSRSCYRSCLRISTAQTSYLLCYLLAVLVLWMICTGVDWIWDYCFKRTLHYSKTRLAIFFATCWVYLYSGW